MTSETFQYRVTVPCRPQDRDPVNQILESALREGLASIGNPGMRITLDYPFRPKPHWTDKPHKALTDILQRQDQQFVQRLQQYVSLAPTLAAESGLEWKNGWFQGLDSVMAYMVVATQQPKQVIEIGSGYSTTFLAAAKRTHSRRTHLTSIDPKPRAEIDVLCDRVIRQPVEDTDIELFRDLEAGDVLFIDSSHRVFTNSDVTMLFLDVIPYLQPGVVIHVHDIFLPRDYPTDWNNRFYSEQYLLAALLLGGRECVDVLMPNFYVAERGLIPAELAQFGAGGVSFWLTKS